MANDIDHSPYAVAHRLDDAIASLEAMNDIIIVLTEWVERLAKEQSTILERLDALEKRPGPQKLKRSKDNE